MSITIKTNPASIAAQRHLSIARKNTEHALLELSSGRRIVMAGDDASGYAIGATLKAQLSGLKQGRMNAGNAISMIQVAEGSLNSQNNILIRMRELSVQAASDSISHHERKYLNLEFKQLRSEFDRIAKNTRFGSQQLLVGHPRNLQFQVGAYGDKDNVIEYKLDADTQASSMGVSNLDVRDRDDASDSLNSIDHAIGKIGAYRANFGAIQERLQTAAANDDVAYENISEARSRIVDADIAAQASKLVQSQIQQSLATSVLAQANQEPERALKLLG